MAEQSKTTNMTLDDATANLKALALGEIQWGETIPHESAAEAVVIVLAALAAAREEVERYHEALEYAKEHLDRTLKNFADSLADGRTERCPACGAPTIKQSLVACCDFHGNVCEDCWGDCEHTETEMT